MDIPLRQHRRKTPDIRRYERLFARARRRLFLDSILAILVTIGLSLVCIRLELFEWWYHVSRGHEGWELDEFACIIFASALVGTVMMMRHLYLIRKLLVYADETEALRQKQNQIHARQDRMAALGKLSGGMAHEINNSLQPLFGLGEFVKRELENKGSEKHVKYMELILSSAQHTKNIIENVLDFTREKNHDQEIGRMAEVVPQIIYFTTDILQSIATFEYLGLDKLNAPENHDFMLKYSKTGLRQVFLNLIKNAAEAMNKTGKVVIEFDLSDHGSSKNSSTLAIRVRDTGYGMSQETQRKIFNPFYTTKDLSEGTGLGLSSALGIIQSLKGTISVRSEEGKGSEFSVLLPVYKAPHPALHTEAQT